MDLKTITLSDKNEMFFSDQVHNVKFSFKMFGSIMYVEKGEAVATDTVAQMIFDAIKSYILSKYGTAEEVGEYLKGPEFISYMNEKMTAVDVVIQQLSRINVMMTPQSKVELVGIKRGDPPSEMFLNEVNTPKSDKVCYTVMGDDNEVKSEDVKVNEVVDAEKKPWWKRLFK